MTVEAGQVWQRLSPRMLLVHPVHEVLRQIPVLIGSVVLGSATGNPMWAVFGLALIVGYGVARWFTTTYRIGPDEVQLRTGVLQRKVLSVPRNRIRSVSDRRAAAASAAGADGVAGQHRSGGQGRRRVRARRGPGRAGATAAVRSCWPTRWPRPNRRRATPGRELARWQPSWLRYSPLSFTGLAMIVAAVGLVYQAGAGAALENSRLAESGWMPRSASVSSRASPSPRSWCCRLGGAVGAAVAGDVRQPGARRDADLLHLEHGLLRKREHTFDMRRLRGGTLRQPLLVRLLGGARLDAVMTGVDGAGEASLLLPPCPFDRRVRADGVDRPADAVSGPVRAHGAAATRRRWTRALALPAVLLSRWLRGVRDGAGVAVAGVGGADGVLRVAGRRPVAGAWASGGRRAGWSRGRAAWSAAATASPPRASSAGRCARRSCSGGRGWRR